ncbi:MAG TPA: O-antigen ligase family protein [Chitinophagaceae bacterium]|nr:O-antigen ligase family protein [Chitinophagaceae bacterium]HPH31840.1 O-antigen ligase family protein [Chitinophagaceae bacterium]HPN57869.1 O-antigen ligase family protein [Chitinophagaceae bacterium]
MTTGQHINPFEYNTGSSRLSSPRAVLLVIMIISGLAFLSAKLGMMSFAVSVGLPLFLVYGYFLFTWPVVGLYTAIAMSFVLIGAGRYVKDVPVGLGLDAVLILTFIALFINKFKEKVDWSPVNKDITYLSLIWFGYSMFQLVNPESQSVAAWFSGRGVALYMFLMVPLTLLLINTNRKLDILLYVWGALSILATLKGIMQLKIGLDAAEQGWLDDGNAKTHVLFGKLRVFSFMSDAGQFGGNQAYSAVVSFIFSMAQTDRKKKWFFLIVSLLAFYGMIISGTRGAISVPLAGFMLFFILRKNIRVLSIGVAILAVVFVFFKYTTIGQGNDQIRRMRTAFDPNDASLQVRLDNQKLLKRYLASRPFGGGIGHGGVKAQKYLPNAFLSQIATDSWYVLVWVEMGIIGLLLHLFILFYTLIRGTWLVMFRLKDPKLKLKISALIAGLAGVMVASYGNAVLGAMPTGMLIYTSMAIILNAKALDKSTGEPVPVLIK